MSERYTPQEAAQSESEESPIIGDLTVEQLIILLQARIPEIQEEIEKLEQAKHISRDVLEREITI